MDMIIHLFIHQETKVTFLLPSIIIFGEEREVYILGPRIPVHSTPDAALLPHRDEDCSNIFSSFSNLRPDSTCLDRGGDFFPCGFFLAPCIEKLIYFTWCNGWPMILVTRAHRLTKLAFRGGVRIINPPLSKFGHMSKSRVMSKSGVHPVYL